MSESVDLFGALAQTDTGRDLLARLTAAMPRDPHTRWWETSDGRQFFYAVERTGGALGETPTTGKFSSGICRPIGFRSAASIERALDAGKTITIERIEISYHRLRKDAKRRAWRLYVARVRELVEQGRGSKAEQRKAAEWAKRSTPPETWLDR